jgi:CRP-like cAMP-binding protein
MTVGDTLDVTWLAAQRGWAGDFEQSALIALAGLAGPARRLRSRSVVVPASRASERAFVLTDGWAVAHRVFADGRCHAQDIYLPGDAIGLADVWLGQPGLPVTTLTSAVVRPIVRTDLRKLADRSPRVATGLATVLARQETRLVRRLASVTRHTAYERVAFLLWLIRTRLQPSDPAQLRSFHCPLSQSLIGDAVGLSTVHVNRSLAQLERDGVLCKEFGTVQVLDNAALERIVADLR